MVSHEKKINLTFHEILVVEYGSFAMFYYDPQFNWIVLCSIFSSPIYPEQPGLSSFLKLVQWLRDPDNGLCITWVQQYSFS